MPNFQFPVAKTTFYESAIYSYGNETETVLQNLSTKTEQFFKWLKKGMIVMLHVHVLYIINGDHFLFSQEIYTSYTS